ncbi:hypothetical protein CVV68_00415 [Arthrobacter livingstonensis]|uniref:Single cache domain-containing protein n=1 Tax=Arthrobacter livingstonensis TaxID=670078 RepID=A0A2V5LF13_9MICC|nr:hypothetical protein CVV68_00415 [Arthrobacter livingstonensis]
MYQPANSPQPLPLLASSQRVPRGSGPTQPLPLLASPQPLPLLASSQRVPRGSGPTQRVPRGSGPSQPLPLLASPQPLPLLASSQRVPRGSGPSPFLWQNGGMRRRMTLRAQLLLLQVVIVLITIVGTGAVASLTQEHQLRANYRDRMIGVAQSISTNPVIIDAFAEKDPSHTIQPITELISKASGIAYAVVMNQEGIRYSHPDPDEIGKHVSTDPAEVLSGDTYVGTQTGTLGESWRVKVPAHFRHPPFRDRCGFRRRPGIGPAQRVPVEFRVVVCDHCDRGDLWCDRCRLGDSGHPQAHLWPGTGTDCRAAGGARGHTSRREGRRGRR